MTPILGHQGGWDELLLPFGAVVVVLGIARMLGRRRRRSQRDPRPPGPAGVCAYCGATLDADATRCAACGFRVER